MRKTSLMFILAAIMIQYSSILAGNSPTIHVKQITISTDWYGGSTNEYIAFGDENGVTFRYDIGGNDTKRQQAKVLLSSLLYAKQNYLGIIVYWWNQTGYASIYPNPVTGGVTLPLGSINIVE